MYNHRASVLKRIALVILPYLKAEYCLSGQRLAKNVSVLDKQRGRTPFARCSGSEAWGIGGLDGMVGPGRICRQ